MEKDSFEKRLKDVEDRISVLERVFISMPEKKEEKGESSCL